MKKLVYLITAVSLASGCADSGSVADRPLLETTWNLNEMPNTNIRSSGAHVPHLRFETERVTGNDGCNNFFGPYKRDKDALGIGLLASTRMLCADIDGFDLAFNKMLVQATRFRISGNTLELYAGEKLLASFVADEKQ